MKTTVYKRCPQHDNKILEVAKKIYSDCGLTWDLSNWKFYCVNQNRGWCNTSTKTITIPLWVMDKKEEGYLVWYVAHELSHIGNSSHGRGFMNRLAFLCPVKYQAFEYTYQFKSAGEAGLARPNKNMFKWRRLSPGCYVDYSNTYHIIPLMCYGRAYGYELHFQREDGSSERICYSTKIRNCKIRAEMHVQKVQECQTTGKP